MSTPLSIRKAVVPVPVPIKKNTQTGETRLRLTAMATAEADWDTTKENVMPVRGGRRMKKAGLSTKSASVEEEKRCVAHHHPPTRTRRVQDSERASRAGNSSGT